MLLCSDSALSQGELEAWSRERMANYKVPRHMLVFDALPLNASNKVLKRELARTAQRLSKAWPRTDRAGCAPEPAKKRTSTYVEPAAQAPVQAPMRETLQRCIDELNVADATIEDPIGSAPIAGHALFCVIDVVIFNAAGRFISMRAYWRPMQHIWSERTMSRDRTVPIVQCRKGASQQKR